MALKVIDQPIVPLELGTKHPILKSWQKLGVTDLATFAERDTRKNWSIRCDNLVVVDVDAKPENAEKACIDMHAFRDKVWEIPTYVVKTRSGNPHAYFVFEERMAHWKKRIGVFGFVDVCMGSNSLVVAAGSVVAGVKYTVHTDSDIQSMPDWLFDKLDHEMRRTEVDERHKKRATQSTTAQTNKQAPESGSKVVTEPPEFLDALLTQHGYKDPTLKKNAYGGYDIVFGYPHKCIITGAQHAQIDGYLFKAASNAIMTGCYSEQCKGRFKCIQHGNMHEQSAELAHLIDSAADKNTHYAIALVAAHLYKDTVKYVGSDEGWFHFKRDPGHWKQDRHGDTMRTLLSTCVSDEFAKRIMWLNEQQRGAHSNAEKETFDDRYKKLNTVMTKLGDGYHKDKLIKEAQALMRTDEFLDKLDDQPILGFNDGIYDFHTMEFRLGRPEDYVSLSVGYNFPDAVDPVILDEVLQVFRDPFTSPDMADYLLKTLASSMDGKRSVAEFFVWTGAGSNGKSTIQELVLATMGPYAAPLDITMWTRPKGAAGSALPELADKRSSRFLFSNEPEASDKLQVAKLKEATGGEKLTARKLYKDPVTYRPKFGIFILANTLPELSKVDGGISRRIRVVPFVHQFRQFPLPGQRLAKPMVMENCRTSIEWRRALMHLLLAQYVHVKDLTAIPLPAEVQQASAEYLEDNNPVGRWLSQHYTITNDGNDRIRASELFNDYVQSTKDRTMTITAFGIAMTQLNNVPKRKDRVSWYYMGLAVRNEFREV